MYLNTITHSYYFVSYFNSLDREFIINIIARCFFFVLFNRSKTFVVRKMSSNKSVVEDFLNETIKIYCYKEQVTIHTNVRFHRTL